MLPELTAQLKTLHLYGMAAALGELDAERTRQPTAPEVWLKRLVDAETIDRQTRSLRYQLNVAKFPIHRDLAGFDWSESRVAKAQMEQLATTQFMADAHNLIFVGGTGTGKTHLATALGVAAIHQGKRVRFHNAVDLVNRLEQENARARQVHWLGNSSSLMPSSWMSWATCPSLTLVGHCCSTWSANSMNAPRWSLPPTYPSLSGAKCLGMQR